MDEVASPRSVEITQLGTRIRALKAEGAEEVWRPLVLQLNQLKDALPSSHPLSRERFAAVKQQEAATKKQDENERTRRLHEQLASQAAKMVFPLTQRKIVHILQTQGQGDDFKYCGPVLNPEAPGMCEGADVWVTEKWDGTTVQATCNGIFKRLDKFSKGSKAKRSAAIADRYELRLVAWREAPGVWIGLESDERIAECVRPYLSRFEQIPPDTCIFFEAVHTKINQAFKHLPGFADIRVFDTATCAVPCSSIEPGAQWPEGSQFLDFSCTIELCQQLHLPMVEFKQHELTAEAAFSWIHEQREYTGVSAALEGFVLRAKGNGGAVAKLRFEYLTTRNEKRALDEKHTYKAN